MLEQNKASVVFASVIFSAFLNATGQILFKAARAAHSDASFFSLFTHLETWAGLAGHDPSCGGNWFLR
jgi:hypothetical protein